MVKDTNADINTAEASVTPNSRNSLPTNPSKKITGRNTTANVMEVEITAKNISLLPSNAAWRIGIPCSNLRKIFSVTTIPSSTTRPVASTMPNSVSTLMEKPARYITKKVATSDIGMSINGRRAVSQLRKKKKITSTTSAKEIISVSSTSLRDRRILVVLSTNTLNVISVLLPLSISASRLLNSLAIAILLAPGCGIIANPTAFTPLYFQLCSNCSGPISMRDTSPNLTIPALSS